MRVNSNNSGVPPTNPFHISRAYGLQGKRAPAAAPSAAPAASSETRRSPVISKLVAGVVPGGVNFSNSGRAEPTAGTLPMYRHPADKNAAATAVNVGRRLDVQG